MLIYVDRLGGNRRKRAFICAVRDCACRYRAKYAIGFEARGGDFGPLSALQEGKVAAQKDILEKKLEKDGLPAKLKGGSWAEMQIIMHRLETCRENDEGQEGSHLLTSQEWVDIQLGTKEGNHPVTWEEWRRKTKEEQLGNMEELNLYPQATTGAFSAEDLGWAGAKEDPPKGPAALPEFGEGETAGALRRIDRSKRP